MTISKEEARKWAQCFIYEWAASFDYGIIFEDDVFRELYEDESDWEAVLNEVHGATVKVSWDE